MREAGKDKIVMIIHLIYIYIAHRTRSLAEDFCERKHKKFVKMMESGAERGKMLFSLTHGMMIVVYVSFILIYCCCRCLNVPSSCHCTMFQRWKVARNGKLCRLDLFLQPKLPADLLLSSSGFFLKHIFFVFSSTYRLSLRNELAAERFWPFFICRKYSFHSSEFLRSFFLFQLFDFFFFFLFSLFCLLSMISGEKKRLLCSYSVKYLQNFKCFASSLLVQKQELRII